MFIFNKFSDIIIAIMEEKSMATIKDIAVAANISPSAVSRILNHDTNLNVPLETRQKVFEIAASLNYNKKPKRSEKISYTLGIVQWFSAKQELEDIYYLLIRQGIEDFCMKNNIHIVRTFRTDPNYTDTLKDVNSIICIGKFSEDEVDYFKNLTSNIVFLDMPINDSETTTITLDFKQAMEMVFNHLTANGHKCIGFLSGREYLAPNHLFPDEREALFIDYCKNNKIEYDSYMASGEFTSESGYDMMSNLIKKKAVPSAIIAASDPIAIGALKALSDNNFKVPEDVSLIGFDNINVTKFTNPPLTTVHAPAYDMGYLGASLLYHILNTDTQTAMKIKLPCKLIERDSVKKINEEM